MTKQSEFDFELPGTIRCLLAQRRALTEFNDRYPIEMRLWTEKQVLEFGKRLQIPIHPWTYAQLVVVAEYFSIGNRELVSRLLADVLPGAFNQVVKDQEDYDPDLQGAALRRAVEVMRSMGHNTRLGHDEEGDEGIFWGLGELKKGNGNATS